MPSHRLKMPLRQARKLPFAFPRRYWIDKNDTDMGLLSLYANAHGEWMAPERQVSGEIFVRIDG